jgi:hypothetical protein
MQSNYHIFCESTREKMLLIPRVPPKSKGDILSKSKVDNGGKRLFLKMKLTYILPILHYHELLIGDKHTVTRSPVQ